MLKREDIVAKLDARLRGEIDDEDLVTWAHQCFLDDDNEENPYDEEWEDVIDDVAKGTFDLALIDQAFVKGGGRTVIRTGYQIGADEHGIVRVRLDNLPSPCPTIKSMRHLGKPLTPEPWDPFDPVGPVIVEPID